MGSVSQDCVALLRGINLAAKNRLPMKPLEQMFSAEGCSEVRSYIQSGNVIFSAKSSVIKTLPARVSARIQEQFGYRVPVVLRTGDELEACIAANPFAVPGADEKQLHVMFLADIPADAAVTGLDPHRSDPDEFAVQGRDVYLKLPNGGARSKLTNQYFDSRLDTVSTIRNWNTVQRLCVLMGRNCLTRNPL